MSVLPGPRRGGVEGGATLSTPWTEAKLPQDCAASLPVSTEQADGPAAHMYKDLVLTSRETGPTYSLSSAQGVRQGDPLGPLMFSLGIRALLDDHSTTLGPRRLILAYLDDFYILTNDPNALEDFQASPTSIQLNRAKSKTTALQETRETGLQLLGSCIGPTAARECFLEAKIIAEEALLAKQVDLPHRHALLVVHQCLQQTLRHLRRSLCSEDLEHLWERWDTSLANSARRIRATASPVPSQAVDNALIALPVKLGGLGILSCKTCAPLSFAAASEASDTLRAPLPDQDTGTTYQTVLSQRERCQEAFLATRDSLLESLDPHAAKSVIEASSLLGRKWLSCSGSAISRYRRLYMHGLFYQGLQLTAGTVGCKTSWDTTRYASGEPLGPWRGQAKRTNGTALATVEGVQVHLEHSITSTQRRNDIRITGSAVSGPSREDIDITIVSLASQDSQITTLPLATTEDDSAAERTAKLVAKPERRGKGETTPPTSFGPTIQASRSLPRRHNGNQIERRSQALEMDPNGGRLLPAGQAALPIPAEGRCPLL
ncbi:hypothetical protein JCM24511_03760 [Saitozyma sp. JCM 24511]|nr:hypothetical protein JCM24511_03760 [Saitozyma sp. JCM 24511]